MFKQKVCFFVKEKTLPKSKLAFMSSTEDEAEQRTTSLKNGQPSVRHRIIIRQQRIVIRHHAGHIYSTEDTGENQSHPHRFVGFSPSLVY